ncbi:S1 family peptidase [Bacillus salitolerans]|uniref:S1 family peptidase n=1 Tax=Bacillus salitolerans TaxID=1437434 RepID=A0ABW4LRW0_9BACI
MLETFSSFQEFNEIGLVYTDKKNGDIIIGFTKENSKILDFKNKLALKGLTEKIKYKKIKYSIKDLRDQQIKLLDKLTELNIDSKTQTIIISVDTEKEKIELELNHIDENQKKALVSIFGDLLIINISNKNIEAQNIEAQASSTPVTRDRNWTKLGGGITVRGVPNGPRCSTTAMAQKDTRYFLITAGHCVDADNGFVYQDNAAVGIDYNKAIWAGLDVGIIQVTNDSTIERRVSNYFFEYADGKYDYDQRITGSGYAWQNERVCKSGIKTNVTCGYIYRHDTTWIIEGKTVRGSEVQTENVNIDYSSPGDSGAIVYDPDDNTVYGVHSAGTIEDSPINGYYGYFTRIEDVLAHWSSPGNPFTLYTSDFVYTIAQ